MRVMLDAHMLGAQEGGNETYVNGLLLGFESAPLPNDIAITALHSPHYTPMQHGNVRYMPIGPGGNIRRLALELPRACWRANADLLHVTYNAPLALPANLVLSVHDVIYRLYPSYFSPRVRLLLNTLLPLSMRRARSIITLSETSRRDIERFYPFTRGRVQVVPIAAGPVATTVADQKAAEQYCDSRAFLLAVGTVQPRKNIARLIEAYILARQRGTIDARLLVVGRAAWQHSAIEKIASDSPYRADILFTGYLNDATVAALYQRCAAFIYPSLYEGFGLPVLEAMACGAPVITSNVSSLPEVAGDAAMLVDPHSVAAIAEAITALLADPALQADLRERGRRQAARFTWRQTAAQTLDIYRRAMERP